MSKKEIIEALEDICSLLNSGQYQTAHQAVHELRNQIEEEGISAPIYDG